jgi:phosphoadenosine phosphosulfate reductase
MFADVSMIRSAAINPATRPELTDALIFQVKEKSTLLREELKLAVKNYPKICFANSFGVEDMVITHLIYQEKLPIEIFSLDTGRLPPETYDLIDQTEKAYHLGISLYFPQADHVEDYVKNHGVNAFYNSVELRKACCHIRKVEPLKRALSGKDAWITGMRSEQSVTRARLAQQEYDQANQLEKLNPLRDWSEQEVWAYIRIHEVPYNKLHEAFYPSIGCAPCTRAVAIGEDIRAGRWWWENPDHKECGLHTKHS